jgi:hypothetical protein
VIETIEEIRKLGSFDQTRHMSSVGVGEKLAAAYEKGKKEER